MEKKIFISHSSKDKIIANQICKAIKKKGLVVGLHLAIFHMGMNGLEKLQRL